MVDFSTTYPPVILPLMGYGTQELDNPDEDAARTFAFERASLPVETGPTLNPFWLLDRLTNPAAATCTDCGPCYKEEEVSMTTLYGIPLKLTGIIAIIAGVCIVCEVNPGVLLLVAGVSLVVAGVIILFFAT